MILIQNKEGIKNRLLKLDFQKKQIHNILIMLRQGSNKANDFVVP